jgi:rod shape determining protein RodA
MPLSRGVRDAFDWPLFVMVSTLAVVGVVNLYSATSAMPSQLRDIYIQQIYWLSFGAAAAGLVASIDCRY